MPDNPEISQKLQQSEKVFNGLYEAGHPVCFTYSGGKDSSLVVNIGLNVAIERVKTGRPVPHLYLTHGDTGVENPEVASHARQELDKIRKQAEHHGIKLHIEIVSPYLSSSWAVRTIGQGKVPAYPGKERDCTVEWKIKPQQRAQSLLISRAKESGDSGLEPVTILGLRFDESEDRRNRMNGRGDSADTITQGPDKNLYATPIAEFTTDQVWEYLAYAGMGAIPSYSDFKDLQRIYADAGGSSCHVVADMATGKSSSKACGARHGCWNCVAGGRDKSMEAMIDKEGGEYHYMRSLNLIQRWLFAIRHDWDNRSWLPRSINRGGYIRLQPDTLGASQIEDLFKFVVSADADELDRAMAEGEDPKFRVIDERTLIAIDAEWSRLGFHQPFHALDLYKRIYAGERHYAPEIDSHPESPQPGARYIYVGNDWRGRQQKIAEHFLPAGEALYESGIHSIAELITESKADPLTGKCFDVDLESACLFLDHFADESIRNQRNREGLCSDITEGFKTYIRMGIIQLSPQQKSSSTEILRRTYYRHRLGLTGKDVNLSELMAKSISEKKMAGLLAEMKANFISRVHQNIDAGVTNLTDLEIPSWLDSDERNVVKRCQRDLEKNRLRMATFENEIKNKNGQELSALKQKIKRCQESINRSLIRLQKPCEHIESVAMLKRRVREYLDSPPGQALVESVKLQTVTNELNQAYRDLLSSEAYVSHARTENTSPVFDGVNYSALFDESRSNIEALIRLHEANPRIMDLVEDIRSHWYRKAIDVAAGIENPFEFGVAMMIAAPTAEKLMPKWANTVGWRKEAAQDELFTTEAMSNDSIRGSKVTRSAIRM